MSTFILGQSLIILFVAFYQNMVFLRQIEGELLHESVLRVENGVRFFGKFSSPARN